MDTDLQTWIAASAAALGLELETARPLRVEASTRSFYRVRLVPADAEETSAPAPTTAIVMDSPPATERNAAFLTAREVFASAGLPVPGLLAADEQQGWFLLTDLGERHFEDAYREGDTDTAIETALQHLVKLQRIADPRIPPYPRERFITELGICSEWLVDGLLGERVPADMEGVFAMLVENATGQPQCCIHLDYHCRNLLLSEDGRFGMVDFQDAMVGPATYDLASLLRDCYHRFDEIDIARWRARYLAMTELEFDVAGFEHTFDLMALQRQLKAVGIFARLHLRDGKDTHLPYIVPVLEVVADTASRHADLAPLAAWTARLLTATGERLS